MPPYMVRQFIRKAKLKAEYKFAVLTYGARKCDAVEIWEMCIRDRLGAGHNQWPFHYAFYPILNLAWGGDWGGRNGVDESALPVTMKVDYVRVFQKK